MGCCVKDWVILIFLSMQYEGLRLLPKLVFLTWAATKGKVPTEDVLKRRNFNLASRCPMCGQEDETVHHLFIHCTCVSGLWHLSFALLGVDWVQPHTSREMLTA